MSLAIIGGSGLARLPELDISRREIVRTPYGLPGAPLLFGKIGNQDIVFLSRHGKNHTIAPAEINYRANIWALHSVGVRRVIAVSAVSPVNTAFGDGDLVLPHDLLDYTHGRADSFQNGELPVVYTDFSEPYHAALRQHIGDTAQTLGIALHQQAVYACVQGARLPTQAELRRLQQDGADVYGMTGMPEAVLAREIGLEYATLCGVMAAERRLQGDTEHRAIAQIRALLCKL